MGLQYAIIFQQKLTAGFLLDARENGRRCVISNICLWLDALTLILAFLLPPALNSISTGLLAWGSQGFS